MAENLSPCPNEDTFVAMLQNELEQDERTALDAHLDGCADCMMLVTELTAMLFPDEGERLQPSQPQIGRYRIHRQVGAGGMGIVYEAWDPTLKRKVALKVLRADLIDPKQRDTYSERLLREAQLLAAVSHPNILTVYEVMTWNNQVVMVVHFVEGMTLGEWIVNETPSWRTILAAYLKIGNALSTAHKRGLIHRDVKPANILMDTHGRAWLTDFGLACVIGRDVGLFSDESDAPSSIALSALTRTGTVMGTPAYMSPEQHLAADTDSRTDQFSFCAALFESIYTTRPFAGDTRRELSMQVCTGSIKPQPASTAPGALYPVLARGLARHPDDRYPDMEALCAALTTASKTSRRPLAFGAAVATLIVVLCVGVAAFAFGDFGTQTNPKRSTQRSATKSKPKTSSTSKTPSKKATKDKTDSKTKKSTSKSTKKPKKPKVATAKSKTAPPDNVPTPSEAKELKKTADTNINIHQQANGALTRAKKLAEEGQGQKCLKTLE